MFQNMEKGLRISDMRKTVERRDFLNDRWQKYYFINIIFNLIVIPLLIYGFTSVFDFSTENISMVFMPIVIMFNFLLIMVLALVVFSISLNLAKKLFYKNYPDSLNYL